MVVSALLALLLAQDDPKRILETIETKLLEAKSVTAKFRCETPPSDPRTGTIQLRGPDCFRITLGADLVAVSDGKNVVNVNYWNYLPREVGETFGARSRSILARAGALWLVHSSTYEDQRFVFLGQEAGDEVATSELKRGPDEGGGKSITYVLSSRSLKARGDLHVRLWYDPGTFRLVRRDATLGQETMRESYSDWSFSVDLADETFKIPPPPRFGSQVRGKITFKGSMPPQGMSVGCLGEDQIQSPCSVDPELRSQIPPFDLKKLAWNPKLGMTYGFKGVRPGKRLVYLHWGERYFDWRWIDVKEGIGATTAEIDLTLEPSSVGSVEVKVAGPAVERVMFVPADDEGRVPSWSTRLVGKGVTATVKDGKALFNGMRPGKYVFYAADGIWETKALSESRDTDGHRVYIYYPPDSADEPGDPPKIVCPAEVKAKAVTRIELK
jgi:outer membrane lipoprotein-sorting protein